MEQILLNKYFDVLVMLGHIGCLWWASATVLCMSIIKLTLEYKMKEEYTLYYHGTAFLIAIFFISLIGYGFFCTFYVLNLKTGVLSLLSLDIIQSSEIIEILNMTIYFYPICTSTFLLMFAGWIYLLITKSIKLKKENGNGSV